MSTERHETTNPIRSILRASGARVIVMALALVCTAIASRIVFTTSGPGLYGAVMLVATVQSMIPFADLGLGAVIMNAVARRKTADADSTLDIVRRVMVILLFVSITLTCLAIVAFMAGWFKIFLASFIVPTYEVQVALLVALISVAWSIPLGIGYRILVGLDKTHVGIFISGFGPLLVLGSVLVLLAAGKVEGWALAIWPLSSFVVNAITFFASFRFLRTPFRDILASPSEKTKSARISILGVSAAMLIISVATPMAYQSHRVILSQFGNAAALAEYSVGAQIYAPILSIITIASSPLWPRFAAATNLPHKQRQLLVKSTLAFAAGGIILGAVTFFAIPLYAWFVTGNAAFVSPLVAAMFASLLVANSILYPTLMRMNDGQAIRNQAFAAVAAAIVVVPIAILMAPLLGAAGPLVAGLAAIIFAQIVPLWLVLAQQSNRSKSRTKRDGIDVQGAEESGKPNSKAPIPR